MVCVCVCVCVCMCVCVCVRVCVYAEVTEVYDTVSCLPIVSNRAATEGSKYFELGRQLHEFFNSKYLLLCLFMFNCLYHCNCDFSYLFDIYFHWQEILFLQEQIKCLHSEISSLKTKIYSLKGAQVLS